MRAVSLANAGLNWCPVGETQSFRYSGDGFRASREVERRRGRRGGHRRKLCGRVLLGQLAPPTPASVPAQVGAVATGRTPTGAP